MKSLVTLIWLLLTPLSMLSQDNATVDRTKLNGTWVFDAKASNADSYTKERFAGKDLTITYVEPELKILEPYTKDGQTFYTTLIFYTDGRGETNNHYPITANFQFTSVTVWQKDVLTRTYKIPAYNSGKPVGDIKYVETYKISRDGRTLTIEKHSKANFTTNSRYGKLTTKNSSKTKRVYQRRL